MMNGSTEAILKLMNQYCFIIDSGDLEGFAQLFEHGTWRVLGDTGGGDIGSQAVLDTLRNVILYDGRPNTKHVMSNVEITVDDSHASAQCYITVFQAVPPNFPLQAIFIGHYHDTFVVIDGEWRFKTRDIAPDLIGDLSYHRADMA